MTHFQNRNRKIGLAALLAASLIVFSSQVVQAQGELEPGHFELSGGYRFTPYHNIYFGRRLNHDLTRNLRPFNSNTTTDVTGTYAFTPRLRTTVSVPVVFNTLSLLLPPLDQPGRGLRNSMAAGGLGDMTIVAQSWLLQPKKSEKQNLLLGIGLKLPTGNWNYQDIYADINGRFPRRKAVPFADQLGDGGVGIIVQANGYKAVNFPLKKSTIFGAATYTINPRNKTGTASIIQTLGLSSPLNQNALVNSTPDSYSLKAGMTFPLPKAEQNKFLKKMVITTACSVFGTPQTDFIGRSGGYRQPYYLIQAEPGLSYSLGHYTCVFNMPIVFYRNVGANLAQFPGSQLRKVAQINQFGLSFLVQRRF